MPDPRDRCYAASQIVKAFFGDMQGERLRELRLKADNWAIKNAVLRGELLDKAAVTRGLERIFTSCVRIIWTLGA